MKELDNLTELQIVKLYNKTNNQKYLDEIDNRIRYIHNSGMDPDKLSNEQLVLLCQKYNEDIYWNALYNKTKNSIHVCINKYANSFYKAEYNASEDKESTDLFSDIRLGWYKAVNTYNILKGNAGFVAYASTLMYQHYIKLTRKVNQKHNGLSVNAMYIESVHSTSVNEGQSNTSKSKIVDAISIDSSKNDISIYETKDFIRSKLNDLKEYDETVYNITMLHYFKGVTQVEITKMYERNKTWVSRQLKKARQFLKSRISDKLYLEIIKELEE